MPTAAVTLMYVYQRKLGIGITKKGTQPTTEIAEKPLPSSNLDTSWEGD